MAEIIVEENRLKEIVDELVRKHIKSSIDDVEEVRRSPAGTILRLEERVEFIQKNMATQAQLVATQSDLAGLKARVETIEKNMATKADVADLRTELSNRIAKVEVSFSERMGKVEASLGERMGKVEALLGERMGKVEASLGERIGKLETGQRLIYALLLTTMAMLVKLVFFP